MKYIEFKNEFSDIPIINILTLSSLFKNEISLRSNINKWTKKKYLYRLKNNLYVFNENDAKIKVSRLFIANNLYFPSYISLEYALYYYSFIPENVYEMTSITTLKTKIFKNKFGIFSYTNINKKLFFGITNIKDENNYNIIIANPEKAILDFVYFRFFKRKKTEEIEEFIEKNRLQNLQLINKKILGEYLKNYNERFKKEINKIIKVN